MPILVQSKFDNPERTPYSVMILLFSAGGLIYLRSMKVRPGNGHKRVRVVLFNDFEAAAT